MEWININFIDLMKLLHLRVIGRGWGGGVGVKPERAGLKVISLASCKFLKVYQINFASSVCEGGGVYTKLSRIK
jgi:hypothetical protein